jgi:hypothetical protein
MQGNTFFVHESTMYIGVFPNKKLANPALVLSVNHQDPAKESFATGIILQSYFMSVK